MNTDERKNRADVNAFSINSEIWEDDKVPDVMPKVELQSGIEHISRYSINYGNGTASSKFYNSDDSMLRKCTDLTDLEAEAEETQKANTFEYTNLTDFEYCSSQHEDHTAYLRSLRNEFKDMPAMMFYNLVRLWHVQQSMSNTDEES